MFLISNKPFLHGLSLTQLETIHSAKDALFPILNCSISPEMWSFQEGNWSFCLLCRLCQLIVLHPIVDGHFLIWKSSFPQGMSKISCGIGPKCARSTVSIMEMDQNAGDASCPCWKRFIPGGMLYFKFEHTTYCIFMHATVSGTTISRRNLDF